jgi:hypothetical protein
LAKKPSTQNEVVISTGASSTDLPGTSPADNIPETVDMTYYGPKKTDAAPKMRREVAVATAKAGKTAKMEVVTY